MAIVQPPDDGTLYSSRPLDLGDDSGAAEVQDVGLAGTDPDAGTSGRVGVANGSLLTFSREVPVGGEAQVTGYTTGTPYVATQQVGAPTLINAPGSGSPFPAGKTAILSDVFVVLQDLEKQLDNTARIWLVTDYTGGGIGDAGDTNPVDFAGDGDFARLTAQSFPATDSYDLASCRKLIFSVPGLITVANNLYFVIEAGNTPIWSADSSLILFVVGNLRGATPAT